MLIILNNSAGWNEKLPNPNQLCEPFFTIPIPGIKTKISKIIPIYSNIKALL